MLFSTINFYYFPKYERLDSGCVCGGGSGIRTHATQGVTGFQGLRVIRSAIPPTKLIHELAVYKLYRKNSVPRTDIPRITKEKKDERKCCSAYHISGSESGIIPTSSFPNVSICSSSSAKIFSKSLLVVVSPSSIATLLSACRELLPPLLLPHLA